jgi:ADP-ribosylglycohydrolase
VATALQKCLLGTLIGDCHGSPYEGRKVTGVRIGSYTDDTEQAYGVALWLLSGKRDLKTLTETLRRVYSGEDRGYGASQADFLEGREHRKDSYGNGAAMRAAPIGVLAGTAEKAAALAALQCRLTHNNPAAIAGSVTVALLAYLARGGRDPATVSGLYPAALLPQPGRDYVCSLAADESVPPAVDAFLRGTSFPDVLHRALTWGNDVDTIAAIACGLAALRLPIPGRLLEKVVQAHPDNARMYGMILALRQPSASRAT